MTRIVTDPDRIFNRSTTQFAQTMKDIARAAVEGDTDRQAEHLGELSNLISQSMILADLLGRDRLMREAGLQKNQQETQFADVPVIPSVEFDDAIQAILDRNPVFIQNATAADVAAVYDQRVVFSLTRAANISVVKRVRESIVKLQQAGKSAQDAAEVIADMEGFTQAYAETVYRTNVATAYSAGRFQQAMDPDLEDFAMGFRYVAVLDSDTRPNHRAAHDLVADQRDPIWQKLAPPLGYNCRCRLELLDRTDVEGMDLVDGRLPRASVPSGAHPDEVSGGSFRTQRPDLQMYGGTFV